MLSPQEPVVLSKYEEVERTYCDETSETYIVKDIDTNQLFVKKILKNRNMDIYKKLKESENIHISNIPYLIKDGENVIVIEEVLEGTPLDKIIEGQNIDEDIFIDVMLQLCDVLDFLHKLKPPVTHNYVKPENIIICEGNLLKLTRFDNADVNGNVMEDIRMLGEIIDFMPDNIYDKYSSISDKCNGEFNKVRQVREEVLRTYQSSGGGKKSLVFLAILVLFTLARVLNRLF